MTGHWDEAAAARAVRDPATSSADIAAIASRHPTLWAQIAAHPAASPTVLESLAALGGDDVRQAIAARAGLGTPRATTKAPDFAPPDLAQQVATPPASPPEPTTLRTRWQWPTIAIIALLLVGIAVGSRYLFPGTRPPDGSASVPATPTPPHPGLTTADETIWIQITDLATNPSDLPGVTYTIQVTQVVPPLTVAQFADLITIVWPSFSGRPPMEAGSTTHFDCNTTAMYQAQAAMLAGAIESPASAAGLRMTLFDSTESAAAFPDALPGCFGEMGSPITRVTVIGATGLSDDTSPIYIMTLSHPAAGPVQVVFLHRWNNVVLWSAVTMDREPNGTDAATQNFVDAALAFDAAVVHAGGG